MSNGEHDYDQSFSALDWTDEGWIMNYSIYPGDLANGYDTRYLISLGSFDMVPGEIETVTVAYMGGSNLHNDPFNYVNNLRYNTGDSLSIAIRYVSRLSLMHFFKSSNLSVYS